MFWVLAAGYVLVYFHRQCAAVLAVDMMNDLHTDANIMGLLGSLYFYPYALMQLPAGLCSDSWGPRRTITLFFLVATTGSVMLGLAPNAGWAAAGRLFVGIGAAMLFVPTLKVLAEWFNPGEFATMTGILMAMGGLGSLISTAPLAFLSGLVGWRNSFLIVGGFTLLLALLVWLIVRDKPPDKDSQSVRTDNRENEKISLSEGVKKVFSEPFFWYCGIWFFFTLAIFFSFAGLWGGPFLMHVYNLSRTEAGNILSMLSIGLIAGSPVLSYISNRILKSRRKVIIICSFINIALCGILFYYTEALSIPVLYALCLGMGIFTSSVVVIVFTTVKEFFPVQIAGTSTGLVNLFPFAGGAVFQQILGWLLQGYSKNNAFTPAGYHHAFLVLFICAVIACAASLMIKETFPERLN